MRIGWTSREDDLLAEMAERGCSASVIASALNGRSRSSVIARAGRREIALNGGRGGGGRHAPRPKTTPEKRAAPKRDVVFLGDPAAEEPHVETCVPPSRGKSLMNAGYLDCRWPLPGRGDDGMPRCCGAHAVAGMSWCLEHAARVYVSKYRESEVA